MCSVLEFLTAFGAIATASVAAWAGIYAVNSQREATAKDIYRDYLKLAFENPEFANPSEFFWDLSSLKKNEQYRWFVAFMLNSCDEIARSELRGKGWREIISLDDTKKREGWRKTILLDLQMHKEYLDDSCSEFKADGGWDLYSSELKNIAKKALS